MPVTYSGGFGKTGKEPDNSAEFFSARRAVPNVLSLDFNSSSPPSLDHPYRYFIAGGESLAKIEQFVDEAKNREAALKALAQKYGAQGIEQGEFVFGKDAEVEPITSNVVMYYKPKPVFISDLANPGKFYPDPTQYGGQQIRQKLQNIKAMPPAEAAAARKSLERGYDATLEGDFFIFRRWEQYVQSGSFPRYPSVRLKSNPLFTKVEGRDNFKPDAATEEGLRLVWELEEISSRQYSGRRFAQWIDSFRLDISNGFSEGSKDNAMAEKVGNEWLIRVPVIVEGIFGADGKGGSRTGDKEGWVEPPGATPIAISDYFARLEKAGALRTVATKTAPKQGA